MLEDSLCRCGHSSLLAHGPQGVGEYEAHSTTCHACKERARAERDGEAKDPGSVVAVIDQHDMPRDADEALPDHSGVDVLALTEVADDPDD